MIDLPVKLSHCYKALSIPSGSHSILFFQWWGLLSESVKMSRPWQGLHDRNFQFIGGTLEADKLQSLVSAGSPLHILAYLQPIVSLEGSTFLNPQIHNQILNLL